MLKITKSTGGFHMDVSPPHAQRAWRSALPMSFEALMQKANALGVPVQDFYDAAIGADPQIRST